MAATPLPACEPAPASPRRLSRAPPPPAPRFPGLRLCVGGGATGPGRGGGSREVGLGSGGGVGRPRAPPLSPPRRGRWGVPSPRPGAGVERTPQGFRSGGRPGAPSRPRRGAGDGSGARGARRPPRRRGAGPGRGGAPARGRAAGGASSPPPPPGPRVVPAGGRGVGRRRGPAGGGPGSGGAWVAEALCSVLESLGACAVWAPWNGRRLAECCTA